MNDALRSPAADTGKATRRRPDELRRLIVVAAEEVFCEQGYADATQTEIAERANVKRSVLYRHFPTKADLFREAMAQPFLGLLSEWIPVWQAQIDSPWPDELLMREFVATMYRGLREHRSVVRALVLGEDRPADQLHDGVKESFRDTFADLRPIIVRELEGRGYSSSHVDLTIQIIFSMVIGLAVFDSDLFPTSLEPASEEQLLNQTAAFILYGVSLRRPEGTA
ncbi:TetR/AcrR family transcriptional regulator [Sporichthya sp.]|uniref:TetR/AcrR family transcriptional regulator n=1 Tax=Sporichthya sp. TaxID=65475 RepID=UPI001812CC82|nr:TetR/AcrR family transcriptional regulator [Sporichthya sp.]MBA3742671.1 TetR/AcrR family transcriptional regulator [Sporichthya sp.]